MDGQIGEDACWGSPCESVEQQNLDERPVYPLDLCVDPGPRIAPDHKH